jgi:outer membrane protein OmpA-like peptidoglycan-associated protein
MMEVRSKLSKFLALAVAILIAAAPIFAQEKRKQRMPLFVSHLSEENAAITRRKEAPRHFFLTRLVCFKKKCRAYIGWRTEQRSKRYNYRSTHKKSRKDLQNTDTVNLLLDKPIRKMPPKKPATPPVQPIKSDSTIVLSEVLFETNSYKLKQELLPTLDSISTYLAKQPKAEVSISGHTDNTGKESYNLMLSSQRAESVAEFLLDNGVSPEQVSFVGFGSSQPIQPNDSTEGRRKNRRVEILIRWKN